LHSPYAVAVSCLEDIDPDDTIPPLTPYFVMRIGRLPLIPYYPPGSKGLSAAVAKAACEHKAVLMAHHGCIVTGQDLEDAVYSSEELEETARLFVLLKQLRYRTLDKQQVAEIVGNKHSSLL
jgi:ribulose-5-phosphate 4-epimerase/fuculose-1-phosphate aldolase